MDLGPKAATLIPKLLLLIGATSPIKVDVCTVVLAKGYLLPPSAGYFDGSSKTKSSGCTNEENTWSVTKGQLGTNRDAKSVT